MKQRVAVVTGAGGGLGQAIVDGLLRRSFLVVATDLSDVSDDSEKLVRRQMDVTSLESVESVAAFVDEKFGRLDVLVNNAGAFARIPMLHHDEERARQLVDVNLLGVMRCTALFGGLMAKRGRGRIVNVASTAGVRGAPMASIYSAAKAGVIAHTLSAARELAGSGITVNAVAPGYCDTPMLAPYVELVNRFIVPRIPAGRLGTPEDVAEVVTFLATCKTTYMTGVVIPLDGGLLLS